MPRKKSEAAVVVAPTLKALPTPPEGKKWKEVTTVVEIPPAVPVEPDAQIELGVEL